MGVKKWTAIGVAVVLIGAIGLISLLLNRSGNDAGYINVYFFDPVGMQMEAEARPLPEGDSQLHDVIMYLHTGPKVGTLSSTWPVELAPQPEDLVSAVILEDSTLFAFFTPVFHEMAPLNQSLFKAAFIHTIGGLPLVSDITILVTDDYGHAFETIMRDLLEEDEQYGDNGEDHTTYMPLIIYDSSHAGVLLNPLDPPISPQWITDRTFNHLHFVDATGTGLVVETYFAQDVNMQFERMAQYALDLLIAGPRQEGAVTLIPSETRIIRIEFDGSDIYVNLSNDFVTRFNGTKEHADLMIHSIVNTLLAEFSAQTRVFFLIETQPLEQFHGIEDFHTGFTRNNTLLLSYIEALAAYMEDNEYEHEEDAE